MMDMSPAVVAKNQIQAFFRAASELRQAVRVDDRALMWEWRDEIEVIELHAESAALRDRCAYILASTPVVEKPAS